MSDWTTVTTGTIQSQNRIRRATIDETTLERVADVLGITDPAERREFIDHVESIHIFRRVPSP